MKNTKITQSSAKKSKLAVRSKKIVAKKSAVPKSVIKKETNNIKEVKAPIQKSIGDLKKTYQRQPVAARKSAVSTRPLEKKTLKPKSPQVVRTSAKKEKSSSIPPKKEKEVIKGSATKHAKKEQTPEKKVKERSRNKEIEKVLKPTAKKTVSKAKARVQELAEEDEDELLKQVKAGKKVKKTKPVVKMESVDEESEHNNIKPIPKEESLSESESSSEPKKKAHSQDKKEKKPIKQIFKGKVDTKGISEEISKIIKRIEEKQKKKGEAKKEKVEKKRKPDHKKEKATADEFNFVLQKNPNIKVEHIINIHEVAKQSSILNSDIMLSLLELGHYPEYYQLNYSPNSIFFWNDVIQYKEIEKIFGDFKPETMKKYWRDLSKIADPTQLGEFLRKNSEVINNNVCKFKNIISGLNQLFSGKIDNFEEYIKANALNNSNLVQVVDERTGEVIARKPSKNLNFGKLKFLGSNFINNPEEILNKGEPNTEFTKALEKLNNHSCI
jgi:hypothetical protein